MAFASGATKGEPVTDVNAPVDPSMAKDPDGNEINTITLSYTFYQQREPSRPVADGAPTKRIY